MIKGKNTASDSEINIEEINYSFGKVLEKKISELPENFTLLFLTSSSDYNEIVLGIIDVMVAEKKLSGVYLTANRQSQSLLQMFSKEFKNIDLKKIFFLDCVSKGISFNDRVVECSPQNLIDLNISANQALDAIPAGGFLIVDSINTLAIYNDGKVLKKFVKTIVEKCYSKKVNGIFLCSKSETMKEFVEDVSQFFDETIDTEKF